MKIQLVLVRHGKSEANLNRICAGWFDTPLSEEGREELHALRESTCYPKTNRYYSSDLSRAHETFEIIYGKNTELIEKTSAFRELSVGTLENMRWDEMEIDIFEELFGKNNPVHNGETVSQMSLRVFGKLTQIFTEMHQKDEKSVTVVCHAGVLMMVLTFLTPQAFELRKDIETLNGLGYILDIDFNPHDNLIQLDAIRKISDNKEKSLL